MLHKMIQTLKSAMNVYVYDRTIQMKDIDLYFRVINYEVERGMGIMFRSFHANAVEAKLNSTFMRCCFSVVLCKVVLAITNVVLFFQFCKVVELEKTSN